MIYTKNELRDILSYERKKYFDHHPYNGFFFIDFFLNEPYMVIWRYQKLLRKAEYYYNNKRNPLLLLLYMFTGRKHNRIGARLGIDIPINVFDKGLVIDHYGCIIVNGRCRIGKDCRLHGNNCIGNKGKGRENEIPIIGDNLDLGVGASILGNLTIGDNVYVGANAVVTKSVPSMTTVVGTPARRLR